MTGIIEIETLLHSLKPELMVGEYVFCTVAGELAQHVHLNPLATFREGEGLTLVLEKNVAQRDKMVFEGVYKQITLSVHSSLDAVGLTAAVSSKLTSHGISANVIAAYYHDHIFVQKENAELALSALQELSL